jgi:hypothetical protein
MPDTSTNDFATLADAQAAVEAHPLCQSFAVTPSRFVVFYPDTYKIPGGAAVDRGNDELAAMALLYKRIDDFWKSQRLQVERT